MPGVTAPKHLPWSFAIVLALLGGAAHGAPESCDECPGQVWYVDASASTAGADGRSWATAYRRLQSALAKASSGDCLWVARGRYYTTNGTSRNASFDLDRSIRMYGGFAGTEKCFNQRDNELGSAHGGGIQMALVSSFRLANCTVRNNRADSGAGLWVLGSGIDILRTEFISNRARLDGGGVYMTSVSSVADPSLGAILNNVTFKHNRAENRGGAFLNADMKGRRELLFVNALFQDNSASKGGAGYILEAGSGGFVAPGFARIVNATVVDNSATGSGSAFAVEEVGVVPGQLYLENSILWNNTGTLTAIAASPYFFSSVCDTLLQPGSPAIDQGPLLGTGPPDTLDLDHDGDRVEPIPLDLDDLPRRVGVIDRGVYEDQGP